MSGGGDDDAVRAPGGDDPRAACGCCTSVELAERLGVAQRTVYRDADALWAAGLPVVGLPGSGFTFEDGEPVATVSLDGLEVAAAVEALRRYAEPWERPVWEALAKRLVAAAAASVERG